MELVDANTKNFLYLTLSQYNKELNPVRMRVSMRRDQPFWGGGNSYIAIESFRVSAAPNPGGLYYKKIPYSWYIGATIKDVVPLFSNAQGEFLPEPFLLESIPATTDWLDGDHDPRYSEKHIRALNIKGVKTNLPADPEHYSELSMTLGVGGRDQSDQSLPASWSDFQSNDPEIVQEYVGRFLNHYRLSKGAWLKLETEGPGKDGGSEGWAIGQITNAPSLSMTGNGFGADGLSYQAFAITNVADCKTSIGAHPPLIAETTRYRPPFTMSIQLTKDELQSELDLAQVEEFWNNIGNNLSVQIIAIGHWPGSGTSDVIAARNRWSPLLDDRPFVRIFCPVGCTMRGPANMFVGGTDAGIVNVENAVPKFPISFQGAMVVGTEFSMTVPANRGPTTDLHIIPGTYHGIIKALPAAVVSLASAADMIVYMDDDAYATCKDAKQNGTAYGFPVNLASILDRPLILTTNSNPINQSIGGKVTIQVAAQYNLGTPPFTNPEAGPSTQYVRSVLASNETDKLILRRPSQDDERYIYTPNEFFYAFNKPLYSDDSKEVLLPFCLQTDENGGFVLRWRDVDPANPSAELIISVDLVTALGLNAWFEYEMDTLTNQSVKDMYYVKRHQIDDWSQSANNMFRWIARTDLSNHIPSKSFHPPQNVPDIGFTLYDRGGQEWTYVDHKVITQNNYTSVTKRIYPDLETDSGGDQYYVYRELPEAGRITNTQQVSVESFATFSEITIVIPNLPFQPMLGTNTDERILASLRMPFTYTTSNEFNGQVESTGFAYYGDLIFNTEPSRSYLKITTDQQLYDCDCEVRLIERDGTMHVMELPYKGEFQIKLRLLQTQ